MWGEDKCRTWKLVGLQQSRVEGRTSFHTCRPGGTRLTLGFIFQLDKRKRRRNQVELEVELCLRGLLLEACTKNPKLHLSCQASLHAMLMGGELLPEAAVQWSFSQLIPEALQKGAAGEGTASCPGCSTSNHLLPPSCVPAGSWITSRARTRLMHSDGGSGQPKCHH